MIRNTLEAIAFYCRLTWLKREREAVNRSVAKAQRKAISEQEVEDIYQEHKWKPEAAQHAVQALQTRYYRDVANRKGIPISQNEGDWEENINAIGTRIMTVEAIAHLRSDVRKEKKELLDIWLPASALIISVFALVISFMNYRKPVAQQIPQPTSIAQATPTPRASPAPAQTPTPPQPQKGSMTTPNP
jgi:hypothetical protein